MLFGWTVKNAVDIIWIFDGADYQERALHTSLQTKPEKAPKPTP
jgi:hypothetical protein